MRRSFLGPALAIASLFGLFAGGANAHPSSGIVIDEQGQVFFADIARGLLKIDAQGKLTSIHKEGGHWLALDPKGSFARMEFEKSEHWPRWFKRRTPTGVSPALITDGGSPLVVHPDGNLYYVSNGDKMIPGGLQITRLSPDGKLNLLVPNLSETVQELGGIKGLASGPDDSLYATCPSAVLKIKLNGTVSTLVHSLVLKDCDRDPPPDTPKAHEPSLRGLAVDSRGTVYVAATGCHCVVKITPDGQVKTILKAERPWSPTGVAIHGEDLYVLEYTNPNSATHENWLPRIRKISADGTVTTLATVTPGR
jgi:sugar lactone lactonase YvrE